MTQNNASTRVGRKTTIHVIAAAIFAWTPFANVASIPRTSAAEKQAAVDFGSQVLPLLRTRCFACHAGREASSGYQLDVRVELLGESNGHPLAVPGNSRTSRLAQVIVEVDPKRRMPPPESGPALTAVEVAILKDWIDQGLPWDDNLLPPPAAKSSHWAFQTPVRPPVPTIGNLASHNSDKGNSFKGDSDKRDSERGDSGNRDSDTGNLNERDSGEAGSARGDAGPENNSTHSQLVGNLKGSGSSSRWCQTPIDAFIAAEYVRHGLSPAPFADRRRLLLRLSMDLTGLPPSMDWLDEFASDSSPDGVARAVDRLLASPRYGERWGRHWLDVARWAESEGFESNHPRPYAWRYRDYVVDAFNRDLPFDLFLYQQIAGDELLPYADSHLIATGFLSAARLSSNEEDKALQRNDVLVDIVNMVGEGVLGLTMGCAQCHNHKFDPITQRDYYRLQAMFVSGQPANLALRDRELNQRYESAIPAALPPARQLAKALFESARERLRKDRLAKLSMETRVALETPSGRRTPEQQELARQADLQLQLLDNQIEREIADDEKPLYDALKKKIAAWEKQLPDRPQTWGFYSPRTSPTSIEVLPMRGFYPLQFEAEQLRASQAYLLVRGNVHRRGPAVDAGWPAVLELAFGEPPAARHDGSRSAFVDWLVDNRHPLTSRVWANRIWQHHFGHGLVETPGDFGLRGASPSHPELLDYLAVEGREQGWSTKRLHRLICTSSVYELAADESSAAVGHGDQVFKTGRERDPENRWLWRYPSRRLEAEAVRDKLLDVAGELDLAAGGPSGDEQTSRRRALYIFQKRDMLPEVQRLFDGANANEPCGRRLVTTVSLQPLYLLNSPFAARMAERFATRVESFAGDDPRVQIETAYRLALGRPPDADERSAALDFLRLDRPSPLKTDAAIQKPDAAPEPWSPLRRFCQILMNLNEFAYLE